MLNSQVTTAQHMERERAYDIVSMMKYGKQCLNYIFELEKKKMFNHISTNMKLYRSMTSIHCNIFDVSLFF